MTAWGGDTAINRYLRWVGQQVLEKYAVALKPVKFGDTSRVVNQVLAGKIASCDPDRAVDLVWINVENFMKMEENQLLYGPFVEAPPNFSLVDLENKPTALADFTIPVDELEAPW